MVMQARSSIVSRTPVPAKAGTGVEAVLSETRQ